MTPDENKYFEDAFSMFCSDGWKEFEKELDIYRAQLDLEYCKDAEEFWKAKGALALWHKIASYQDRVERQYDAIQREEEEWP